MGYDPEKDYRLNAGEAQSKQLYLQGLGNLQRLHLNMNIDGRKILRSLG